MFIENRSSFRFPYKTKVLIITPQDSISAISENLSAGGLLLQSVKVLSPGLQCRCLFMLEEDATDPIDLLATIKRTKPLTQFPEATPGMALQFNFGASEKLVQERLDNFMTRVEQNMKIVSTLLSQGEPDILSLKKLIRKLNLPETDDFSEIHLFVERILKSVELIELKRQNKN